MDGVDYLADVRLLERLDTRIEWEHLIIDDGGDLDPIGVIRSAERMALDVVRRGAE